MHIDITEFPTIKDITNIVIAQYQYNPDEFSDIAPAFGMKKLECPFKASDEMVEHVSYIGEMRGEANKLEALIDFVSSREPISRQVPVPSPKSKWGLFRREEARKFVTVQTKPLTMYYSRKKVLTRNARQLFEHSMENGTVPADCLENTLLWLALGNSVGLKIGAYEVTTGQEIVGGKRIGNVEDHREHIVPAVFVKGDAGYHAIKVEPPDRFGKTSLVQQYACYEPCSWRTVVLAYLNNYRNHLEKQSSALKARVSMLDRFLKKYLDGDNLLMMNHAMRLLKEGKYQEALPLFETVQKEHEIKHGRNHNSHAEALLLKGKCLFWLGRYDETIEAFEEFFPKDMEDEFYEYRINARMDWCSPSELLGGFRGVKSPYTIGNAMVLWGSSLKYRAEQKGVQMTEEESQMRMKMFRLGADFGFLKRPILDEIVKEDFTNCTQNKHHPSHEGGDSNWYYVLWMDCLISDYQEALKSGNRQTEQEVRNDIQEFMYETMMFNLRFDKPDDDKRFSYLKTRNLLEEVVQNKELRKRVGEDGLVRQVIGDEAYLDIMNGPSKDFNIGRIFTQVPYRMISGSSAYYEEMLREKLSIELFSY